MCIDVKIIDGIDFNLDYNRLYKNNLLIYFDALKIYFHSNFN